MIREFTVGELMERELWAEVCELTGVDPYCVSEGIATSASIVQLTEQQMCRLGLLESCSTEGRVVEEAKLELSGSTDYELCALFCDYREWLDGPMAPSRKPTREKYEGYLKDILGELGNRHGFKPSEGELAFMADAVGADAKPYLRDMGEEQLRGCQDTFKTLVRYCDEVLKEKGEQ